MSKREEFVSALEVWTHHAGYVNYSKVFTCLLVFQKHLSQVQIVEQLMCTSPPYSRYAWSPARVCIKIGLPYFLIEPLRTLSVTQQTCGTEGFFFFFSRKSIPEWPNMLPGAQSVSMKIEYDKYTHNNWRIVSTGTALSLVYEDVGVVPVWPPRSRLFSSSRQGWTRVIHSRILLYYSIVSTAPLIRDMGPKWINCFSHISRICVAIGRKKGWTKEIRLPAGLVDLRQTHFCIIYVHVIKIYTSVTHNKLQYLNYCELHWINITPTRTASVVLWLACCSLLPEFPGLNPAEIVEFSVIHTIN